MRITKPINDVLDNNGNRMHRKAGFQRGVNGFVGVDGEGMMINGVHTYITLDIGGDTLIDPNGIQFNTALHHLYKHNKPGTAYVGYYLGYDFTQILKTLPVGRARILLTKEGIKARKMISPNRYPFPVEWNNWEFDILDKKRLRFRRKLCNHKVQKGVPLCKCKQGEWMFICDAGPFFQTSFLNAINPKKWAEPIVTDEEYAIIKKGKERRATAVLDDEMLEYNRLENEILSRAMNVLNDAFKKMGIYLPSAKWYGPGACADYWLEHIAKLKKSYPSKNKPGLLDNVPKWALEMARETYFGGWFCIQMHGKVPGVTWEYDINSAYPYIITNLPCLECGEWSKGIGEPTIHDNEIGFVYATVKSNNWNDSCYIGTMLHRRKDMSILRPMTTKGRYIWSELQAAINAGLVDQVTYHSWIKYTIKCPHKPLSKVGELYQQRLRVGKETPLGKALKLLYNSMYGKFAQSVSQPKFANPIYASLITSGCREMIINAIGSHPYGPAHVAMVATDGVYFVTPHTVIDVEIQAHMNATGESSDNRLGKWGREEKSNLTLFKPGVYWDDKTRAKLKAQEDASFKSRGISAKDMGPFLDDIDRQFDAWGDSPPGNTAELLVNSEEIEFNNECPLCHGTKIINGKECLMCSEWIYGIRPSKYSRNDDNVGWPIIEITTNFVMVTAKQALQRNDWSLAGKVSECVPVIQNSDPESKRENVVYVDYLPDGRRIYRTYEYKYPALKLDRNIRLEEWLIDDEHIESLPYDKRFGMEDPFSDEYKEQFGENADGLFMDQFYWELMD